MAAKFQWKCYSCCFSSSLQAFKQRVQSSYHSRAPFSTNQVKCAAPLLRQKPGAAAAPARGEKLNYRVKKKTRPKEDKRPAPGERRAMRKRVVLSNTNALEVKGMQDITETNVSDTALQGKVFGIPMHIVDQLKALEAFKPTQSWSLFRRPGTLWRSETIELGRDIEAITAGNARGKVVRKIMVGKRGSGKSVHLLQAMAMAILKGWVVINIPEAQDVTNAHTDYSPIPGSTPTTYFQKTYTASFLGRIAAANPQLAELTVTQSHELAVPVQPGLPLSRLCSLGSSDPSLSYQIFNALLAELTLPSRPPLLLTLDGLQHIMTHTAYSSPSLTPLHAHDFHLCRWFLAHLSSEADMPNGGAVLAALTHSNAPSVPTLDALLKQMEVRQALAAGTLEPSPDDLTAPFLLATGQKSNPIPQLDPYFKHDQRVLDYFTSQHHDQSPTSKDAGLEQSAVEVSSTIHVQGLNGLSKEEARVLMEYWALSGMLRHEVSERLVGEKWALSGGGMLRDLERGCIGTRA